MADEKLYIITPEVEKAIKKIETIDKKQRVLDFEANAIIASSPVGQPPPVLETTLNKILILVEQKAKIWNEELRSKMIIGKGKTLWQLAVGSKLPVGWYGKENILNFYGEDIRNLITRNEKTQTQERRGSNETFI